MSKSFKQLKNSRSEAFESLSKKLENTQQYSNDESKIWKLTLDKAGNGYAIIRFLPEAKDEDVQYVKVFRYGFKNPRTNRWYIENSLNTLGQKDPVADYNGKLWATGIEANKQIVRSQARLTSYYSNIYVVKDSANPENEGKVFLYRYGASIFNKLKDAMNPKFDDEVKLNPFDLWEGADFKLKAVTPDGDRFPNYDKSEFAAQAPLSIGKTPATDEQLEEIWNQQHSLNAIIAPEKFKSYEDLQKRLQFVLGEESETDNSTDDEDDELPVIPQRQQKQTKPVQSQKVIEPDEDEDDGMDFFKQLAAED